MQITALPGDKVARPTLVAAPHDPHRDQDEKCPQRGCGHAYYRHFDSYGNVWDDEDDTLPAVGCKYCGCGAFAGLRVPTPPQTGTVAHLLTVTAAGNPSSLAVSLHATLAGAARTLAAFAASHDGLGDLPEDQDGRDARVEAFFAHPARSFTLTPLVVQS
jgi:hypothetical protein